MLVATTAAADELILGANGNLGWESNVFNTQTNKESDFVTHVGPTLEARSRTGDLQYDVRYLPTYEDFARLNGIDVWNHFAHADGTWHWSDATQVSLNEDFAYSHSLTRGFEAVPASQATLAALTPSLVLGRLPVMRNLAELDLSHQFSPRWTFGASFSNNLYRFPQSNAVDSTSTSAQGSLRYSLSLRDSLGLGLGAIRQDFSSPTGQDIPSTNFYRGFVSWTHGFSRTLSLSVAGGPAATDTQAQTLPGATVSRSVLPTVRVGGNTFPIALGTCSTLPDGTPFLGGGSACQPLPVPVGLLLGTGLVNAQVMDFSVPGERVPSQTSLTFFGDATLTKYWKTANASLNVERTAGSSAGIGGSTEVTSATGRWVWRPSWHWTTVLVGSWQQQTSFGETLTTVALLAPNGFATVAQITGFRTIKVSNALDLQRWNFQAYVERRLTRRFRVYMNAFYDRQRSNGNLFRTTADFDSVRVMLGVRYELTPIHF